MTAEEEGGERDRPRESGVTNTSPWEFLLSTEERDARRAGRAAERREGRTGIEVDGAFRMSRQ